MGSHLTHPLRDQARGCDNEDALDEPTDLEFSQHEPGFDSLAEPHFVSEQIPDAVTRHGPRQGVDLVGKRDDRTFERCDKAVALQGICYSGRSGNVS